MGQKESKEESEDNEENKTRYNIIFIGDTDTEKTQIITRIMENEFNEDYEPPIGVDFISKNIKFKKNNYKLQIWDTPGQEKYKGLIPSYLRGSSLVFLIYNISLHSSFNNIPNWIKFIREIENPLIVLCGNMIGSIREVEKNEGEELAKKEGLLFFEINSKINKNIKKMFYSSIAELSCFKDLNLSKDIMWKKLLEENEPNYYIVSKEINIEKEKYFIIFKRKKNNKILITCEPEDELISLYNYYKEISFEEFKLLGISFKQYENIDEIFEFLKNIVKEIYSVNEIKPEIELKILEDDNIILLLKIQLSNNKSEEIKIEFNKNIKDTINQFKKLKEKYKNLKYIIYKKNKNKQNKKNLMI